ncbi:MAG: GatB/YqeY domain-containing protein [Flavobacteriales bacterium]|nr:GatB/YqeY domain-containing protein [Flavobacteriales bacterium]
MSLESKIMPAMKVAMKEKNQIALASLRAIKSQIILEKTSGKGTELSEENEIALLQRLVKQRKESAEMFASSGREELAQTELEQAKVIEQFLPKQLTPEELQNELQKIISDLGVTEIKEIGKVMGVATKQLAGKAEGKLISETVKKILAN